MFEDGELGQYSRKQVADNVMVPGRFAGKMETRHSTRRSTIRRGAESKEEADEESTGS